MISRWLIIVVYMVRFGKFSPLRFELVQTVLDWATSRHLWRPKVKTTDACIDGLEIMNFGGSVPNLSRKQSKAGLTMFAALLLSRAAKLIPLSNIANCRSVLSLLVQLCKCAK